MKRAIEKIEPATPEEAKIMTELSIGLAEAATNGRSSGSFQGGVLAVLADEDVGGAEDVEVGGHG